MQRHQVYRCFARPFGRAAYTLGRSFTNIPRAAPHIVLGSGMLLLVLRSRLVTPLSRKQARQAKKCNREPNLHTLYYDGERLTWQKQPEALT
jgi:hypothetical protein